MSDDLVWVTGGFAVASGWGDAGLETQDRSSIIIGNTVIIKAVLLAFGFFNKNTLADDVFISLSFYQALLQIHNVIGGPKESQRTRLWYIKEDSEMAGENYQFAAVLPRYMWIG